MNIHEYQAKRLLAQRGVAVPRGEAVADPAQARAVAERLAAAGAYRFAVKSQIHAGGRGQGTFTSGLQGGVGVCSSPGEVETRARAMLGQVLVTRQTGPAGRPVNRVLVEEALPLERELYVAVLLERAAARPWLLANSAGGMDIEEVAATAPDKIIRELVDARLGLLPFQARKVATGLGLAGELLAPAAKLLSGLYQTWWECDASLLEINPLGVVRLADGKQAVMAIDAKIALDDNGLLRHPELAALRDLAEESPLETEASQNGLNYIKLDGDIACLVNGAGLAMATMDIIKHCGGNPANFLDVGGGASPEQVASAFRIILKDPAVKAILVNIFGGIMDCDVIARGIVAASRKSNLSLPLVVRLEGNNVAAAQQTLLTSGLPLLRGDSMADAAAQVVAAARR